jgi:hypothetical protein
MSLPRRQTRQAGRHALVDGIPFVLPVDSQDSPALMAAFTCDGDAAQALLPGNELHILRLPNGRGLFVVTVIDYLTTDIGSYVEYSLAFACTMGARARSLLAAVLRMKAAGTGQYVWDLGVSSLISVKGGKGIWGMPKHQANLDFRVDDERMSSQYDLDGKLCMRVTVERPHGIKVPLRYLGAVNWCEFRGLMMKSSIYFSDHAEVAVGKKAKAQLLIGDHPRMDPLRGIDLSSKPLFVACLPNSHGVLDDHFEGWFLSSPDVIDPDQPIGGEGLASVVGLPNSEAWLDPPSAAGRLDGAAS